MYVWWPESEKARQIQGLLIQTKRKKSMKPSKQSMDQRTTQFTP